MIHLRPHHGLCIRYFEGKGYSDSFVKNMTSLIEQLNSDTEIMLVCEKDEVCKCCPNHENKQCNFQDKVLRYDRSVLEAIGGREYDRMTYGQFHSRIQEQIMNENRFFQICGDCEWSELCHR